MKLLRAATLCRGQSSKLLAASSRPALAAACCSNNPSRRLFSAAAAAAATSNLPPSIPRVGAATAFPDEYPGQNYIFNWCLNADGVTPLKKCAFRITKPLDLKVAGLALPKSSPLKVNAKGDRSKVPEAGMTDALSFDTFDEVMQQTKDSLSLSDALYCPEGHAPSTKFGVRVITNSTEGALVSDLMAYLERMPKRDPTSQSVTCYVLGGPACEEFAGYAIEEVEEQKEDGSREAVSVATVVITGEKPSLKRIVAGIELSVEGLEADAVERAEKKAEEEKGE
eukprot:CAMPEP_0201693646 /NCGR_PEP_ID=MMETSP0578-20130828/6175_1 /ASSEMBLY_ACC=CAM_ASM_000663 /TAXON_ID=267565 /ORGANISM="Skeletonema grethea, Strain CCMP 1804" /LENGTH=281 /DNA_ID=CAMNT_0048179211 /DNA_START=46 /DNA_END=891 /DNA_ORIENTATION=-